jgi:catechol 2,3-dioxygenase-like lactoylglutathione lyase family enzyme
MSQGSKVVEATSGSEAVAVASGVHHIGVSVASRDDALAFWESFLGRKATWRTRLDRPYLGEIIGIPGVEIDGAFIDLPGGVILELLEYQTADKLANPAATQNPGNVHLCLVVEDADFAWRRAVECGAQPVRRQGPVDIDAGPNVGARAAYLRIHDGVTLEVFQRPPAARAEPA